MKTFVTWLLSFAAIAALAQEPIEVKVEKRPSSQGIQPAFEVVVPQATPKEAIDLWKKTILHRGFLKKKAKMDKVKDEWQANDVLIADITSVPLNVITQVSSFPGHIYVRAFFQSHDGFLGSDGASLSAADAAMQYVRNYGVDLYRLAVRKELKEEEKKLKSLEKDMKKLRRKNSSYDDKISDTQLDRAELSNEADLQKQRLQNPVNDYNNDNEGREDLEKQIKSTKKELKKAEKTVSRYGRKVTKNEKEQRQMVSEIDKQMQKVKAVSTKLENIR